jgi:small subunit ribosomal protein S21
MIIIEVKGSIEKSLKKYKRKFENLKISKQLRDRKHFKKKSVERRDEIKKAIYVQQKFTLFKLLII